jgi:hypothetical protein
VSGLGQRFSPLWRDRWEEFEIAFFWILDLGPVHFFFETKSAGTSLHGAMTTSSKVKRYYLNQKDEEAIFEISKDLIESSIATVCMNRHIFPRRIFHSICTQDRDLLMFRRDDSFLNREKFENESQISLSPLSWAGSLKTWVQEASSACHSTQIDPTVTEWQKVEIQLILDWLQNEACTNLNDFATSKIVFDIVRSFDDVILEEYEVR